MDIWIYLILFIISIATLLYLKKRRTFELGKQFNGPPTIPFVGNGNLFLKATPEGVTALLKDLHTKYGSCYRLWFGYNLLVVLSDPVDVEVILSSTSASMTKKSDDYKFLEPWLGSGLLLASGHKWFSHRKALSPAFHFKILEQFIDDFDEQTNIFVDKLKVYCDNDQVFDIVPHVVLCALDIICVTSMGTSISAQTNSESEYVKAIHNVAKVLFDRMFNILTTFDLYFKMTKNYQLQKKSIKVLHEFTNNIIQKRRQELVDQKKDNPNANVIDDENDLGIKKKMPLLDVLLNVEIDGKHLTNSEIREEVDTFMFAGHDTTTSATSFVLYNLAKHSEIQQKVFEEIRFVIGDDVQKAINYKDLNDLKYLEMVIKESIRMYPPVPCIARHLTEENSINGKIYPKDTNISIPIFLMNNNTKYFEDPEKFIPERFNSTTNAEKQNPYAFIPFSAGPRNCIGQKFAMLEIKATVSKVLRHYELLLGYTDEEIIIVCEMVTKSKNGINLKLKKRVYE